MQHITLSCTEKSASEGEAKLPPGDPPGDKIGVSGCSAKSSDCTAGSISVCGAQKGMSSPAVTAVAPGRVGSSLPSTLRRNRIELAM